MATALLTDLKGISAMISIFETLVWHDARPVNSLQEGFEDESASFGKIFGFRDIL